MNISRVGMMATIVAVLFTNAGAADWPQFRGPDRNGVSAEKGLARQWPKGGPPLAWTFDKLGTGYSGPAVIGDRLYVSCGRGDSEYLVALDLKAAGSPRELWATRIGPIFTWRGNDWNNGPNASPTADGDAIYALGGFGDLVCVEAATGKERWRKNIPKTMGGEVDPIGGGAEDPTPLGWGYAWSPLVDGDHLICVPGGKKGLLAALDKKTGEVVWQSKSVTDQASYSSPIVAEVGGVRQYIQVTNAGMVGVSAKDGSKLWSYRREPAYADVVIASPIFADNHVFASVGFGQGCDLIKLVPGAAGITVETVYSKNTIQNRDGGVVLIDGRLYGHSEGRGWFCVELQTGKVAWNDRNSLARGSVTAVDGLLICCAEKGGTVALVEATPAARNEKGRFQLPKESTFRQRSGGLWTHPVVANGKLYIRDQDLLFCYDLKP
ncbi:PQQ-binding-like beta-propeller repeat protein [Humisphaera borealis]|uniref:PQQ-like beta-propeller repeat protein n=1 Tax=Humisphaera borealis TaxID=2807512 RepID=A0A7M2WWT4_9BACT|nr:PQQ-binding-like beta-propeller repeat protein [Humisphaera borealis]QOV89662.1 PQQ-like beta-propeller repeat protein [Humisphaera borealis]